MTEFRVHRVVPKPVDEVWAAFTDPIQLAAWFWPPRFAATVDIDLRVGGAYRVASVSAGMAVSGEYLELDAPGRLVQTWQWEGEDEQTLVTMTFLEVQGGTGLTLLHERFGDAEAAKQNEIGWNDCLDRLAPAVDQGAQE